MPEPTAAAALTPVRVWDLPTRLFHWLLALAVVGSVVSAKIGGGAMVWHFRFGYVVLILIGFRVLWGLVGGRWSRFASFIYSPATLWRYLRGQGAAAARAWTSATAPPARCRCLPCWPSWPCSWAPAWWPTTRSPTRAR